MYSRRIRLHGPQLSASSPVYPRNLQFPNRIRRELFPALKDWLFLKLHFPPPATLLLFLFYISIVCAQRWLMAVGRVADRRIARNHASGSLCADGLFDVYVSSELWILSDCLSPSSKKWQSQIVHLCHFLLSQLRRDREREGGREGGRGTLILSDLLPHPPLPHPSLPPRQPEELIINILRPGIIPALPTCIECPPTTV